MTCDLRPNIKQLLYYKSFAEIDVMKLNSCIEQILTILVIKIVFVYGDGEGCGGPASGIIATKDGGSCGYHSNAKGPSEIKTGFGAPVPSLTASLTVGRHGPILLQDSVFIDELQHFTRERIPERVVHAKGAGAFGYFECTHDITKYTKAEVFSHIGQRTAVTVRFSDVTGESGTPDTIREPRGFAVKFYTQDGILDLIGLSVPVFFIGDPVLFPSQIHSQKRNPVTNLKDPTSFWDFFSLRPESINQIMYAFSDRGIPNSYRHIEGHPIHTFKLVNRAGEMNYARFHFQPDQGLKFLSSDEAAKMTGIDPDYFTRDLYTAIENGTIPSWTMYIQIMTPAQAKSYKHAFDATKILPPEKFPYIPVGKLVLNRNPNNYFADVEQLAFDPRNLIPGIEPSPDKLFQGRMLAYSDAQLYRLGTNYLQLPVNCPYRVRVTNYQRDGPQTFYNQKSAPNYYPNSFGGPQPDPRGKLSTFFVDGIVDRYDTGDEDAYDQPRQLWIQFNEGEKIRFVQNIVEGLNGVATHVQEKVVDNFSKVDKTLGDQIRKGLMEAKIS